jgi:hypothetical protein
LTRKELMMTDQALAAVQESAQPEAPHKAYIRSLTQIERDRLGHTCGVSGAYVTSLVYREANTVSLQMAIAIDKHSGGRLDFRDLVARRDALDWDFVKHKLNAG